LEGRTDRSVKADMEGGGAEYVITTCDFILNSKCAKIVWRPGCARTRKEILSVPLDSQRHSGRLEKEQSLTPLRSYVRFAVGEGRGNIERERANVSITIIVRDSMFNS